MDEYAGKREQNARFRNRIGCSDRLNSVNDTPYVCSGSAISSSSGKGIIGSSSRVRPSVSNSIKYSTNPRKNIPSQPETSSDEDEQQVPELIPPSENIQRGLQPGSRFAEFREVQSSSVASNTRPGKAVVQGSSSASPGLETRANTSRYGLRNPRCNYISNVAPSGRLSSDSSVKRRKDTIKRRNSDGEGSSSSQGKKLSGSSLEGRNNSSSHSVSISADSRQARIWKDSNVVRSVRTRRSNSSYARGRFPNQANGNSLTLNEHHAITPQVLQSDMPLNSNDLVSTETVSARTSSHSQSDSISGTSLSIVPSCPLEVGINHTSVNQDTFPHYNRDGIAEVLALERIEQDEDLIYEQYLALQTNLFHDGLNFYDQHRDMRLDIDNMSYEELLDLEERMGNVSTVLSEEVLSKCLAKTIYGDDCVRCDGEKDDIKCSICQEEYVNGDELGRMQCEHRFHLACIKQWLQVKNWCPICKGSPHN